MKPSSADGSRARAERRVQSPLQSLLEVPAQGPEHGPTLSMPIPGGRSENDLGNPGKSDSCSNRPIPRVGANRCVEPKRQALSKEIFSLYFTIIYYNYFVYFILYVLVTRTDRSHPASLPFR